MTAGTKNSLRVLIIGASGTFGSLLARNLAAEAGIHLILAGRRREPLEIIEKQLGIKVDIFTVNRNAITTREVKRLRVNVVVDAAGPFQGSSYSVVEAAIGAGAHYLDLADGRDFVAGISRFDAAARKAGVNIRSGTSTTPALIHSVIDDLTRGWQRIDRIAAYICPGQKAPIGLSVIRGVFSYVGKPVKVYQDGAWTWTPGWGGTRRVKIKGLGHRFVSIFETPDLDLLVDRFRPHDAALFYAGLESPFQHLAVSLFGIAVRKELINSLLPFAPILQRVAGWMKLWGRDQGAARIDVTGCNTSGHSANLIWTLVAPPGEGPNVPTFASIAMIRRFRDGMAPHAGAGPCVGILSLDEFQNDFRRIGATTEITHHESR